MSTSLWEMLMFVPTLIGLYVYRMSFVFSLYGLMVAYGLFSGKKKIVPYKYSSKEKVEGSKNLIHDFAYLANLPNGIKFHYVTNKDTVKGAYTVVFLHGILESWYSWKDQLLMLDNMNIPCIAIDFKNHGNTSAHYAGSVMNMPDLGKNFDLTHQGAEIAELLKQLDIVNVVLVTTDLGSLVADKLLRQFYKPNIVSWIRCHEPMPAYENQNGLPQQYMFWFNKKLSLFLMHNSSEMLLRLFYRATGWKSVESFSATHKEICNADECMRNAICLYEDGPYKGYNANYMSWCGAYGYAFVNDLYTGPALNYHCYENCECPVFLIFGEFDKSCLKKFCDGTESLGYKIMNGTYCSKMISEPHDGYHFFNGSHGVDLELVKPRKPTEYFGKSKHCEMIFMEDVGHMSHVESPSSFNTVLHTCLKKMTEVNNSTTLSESDNK